MVGRKYSNSIALGLVLALVSFPIVGGCTRVPTPEPKEEKIYPEQLIPDAAEYVLGLKPKAIMSSKLYKEVLPDFERDLDYEGMMMALSGCSVDPGTLDSIVIGANQAEQFVAVISGEGMGAQHDGAVCLIKALQKGAETVQSTEVTRVDGQDIIQFDDGRAYLVDRNMMVLVSPGWQDAVGELLRGKGTAAISHSKKDLYAKAHPDAPMWFIAEIPAELAGMAAFTTPEAADVKTLVGHLRFDDGVSIHLAAGFPDEVSAARTADKLVGLFESVKDQTPTELRSVVDSVVIAHSGSDVTISASATVAEMNAARAVTAQDGK
jgi:hypothetical protein